MFVYICIYAYTYTYIYKCVSNVTHSRNFITLILAYMLQDSLQGSSVKIGTRQNISMAPAQEYSHTVSFHNFKSQNFKLSVSNPKSKYVAYLSLPSQISNCQSLGRKNKHEILKIDRTCYKDIEAAAASSATRWGWGRRCRPSRWRGSTSRNTYIYICTYIYIYREREIQIYISLSFSLSLSIYIYMYVCMYVYIYIYTHTSTYIYICYILHIVS